MRKVEGYSLWLGNIGDMLNLTAVLDNEIRAIVDLAAEEPIPQITRDLIYHRFPLQDGAGNDSWLLDHAVSCVARLIAAGVPTLIYCSAGMSRTPAIGAAAIARTTNRELATTLRNVGRDGPTDVSPGLIADLQAILQ
ncbi:MAG: dual specificity protein phosphatase family protein [Planctomycetaceae bacterium]|nr:dual specificity protein phosphatase family protein [Planctomycetaceae bacterium]